MTLEFLSEKGRDTPAVLIKGPGPGGFKELRGAAVQLHEEADREIRVEALPGFQGIHGCGLTMTNVGGHSGVLQVSNLQFRWVQDREGWAQIGELIDPFLEPRPGTFQFLESGDISVIISTDGQW